MRAARRQPDRSKQDHRKAARSDGWLREDLVAAFGLSVVIAVAGLFLIAAFVLTTRAFAETSAGVDVGDGEVSIDGGEVYAGDGCVRAGDVVVGDCGAGSEDGEGAEDPADTPPTTLPETTSPEEGEDTDGTTEETTAPEVTSTEEATDPESTEETGLDEVIPPPTDVVACPTEPTGMTHEATVTRVVDGDTFEIRGEIEGTDRVRLTGVDSPEMDADVEDGSEPGAERAKLFSAKALEGEDVVLETDEDTTDDYGRLLAHVWTTTQATSDASDADAPDDAATGAAEKELEKRGLLSDLRRLVGMDTSDDQSGDAAEAKLFNAALLEAGHADVLTVHPNDAYAGCFEAIGKQAEQGEAAGEQYAQTDEQYRDKETMVEKTTAQETDPEQTVPREPERITAGETTSQLSETTMESAPPVEPSEPVEETTSLESTQPVVQETTAAPDEQYDAPTDAGTVVPENEQPETTPEAVEETTSADEEIATQPEAAPPAEISLDSPSETAPTTTEETPAPKPVAEPVPEPTTETYTPSETATETGSLPTVQTPEGPIAVLPDTGGPSTVGIVAPVLGAVCICAGTLGFFLAALFRARSRRDPRSVHLGAAERR